MIQLYICSRFIVRDFNWKKNFILFFLIHSFVVSKKKSLMWKSVIHGYSFRSRKCSPLLRKLKTRQQYDNSEIPFTREWLVIQNHFPVPCAESSLNSNRPPQSRWSTTIILLYRIYYTATNSHVTYTEFAKSQRYEQNTKKNMPVWRYTYWHSCASFSAAHRLLYSVRLSASYVVAILRWWTMPEMIPHPPSGGLWFCATNVRTESRNNGDSTACDPFGCTDTLYVLTVFTPVMKQS